GVRAAWYTALRGLFARFDVLALPTAQCFPFDAEMHWPREIAGRPMDSYHRWMEVVIGGTLSGCPVVSVPAGFGEQGLPMGLQLIGPMRSDMRLLQIAAAWEKAADWSRRVPPGIAPTSR
ncbi:MAG: amidase family protein, partial [Gammaproteobacteria bacterium]